MLELCYLVLFRAVYALPSGIPSATVSLEHSVIASRPTPAPKWHPDLAKRDLPLNICGWMDGNLKDPFSCVDPSATCLWDNEQKIVGCGTSKQLDFVTSCFEYASASNCDDNCRANPSNSVCPSSMPYCSTVMFPDSFSIIPCGTVHNQRTAQLTFGGQSTTVALPRSVVNGVLAFGATIPASMTSTTSSASASPTAWPAEDSGVNVGSIIAGSIGGGVLLLGMPFGIKMYLRRRKWKKAQRPRRLQEREMRRQWAETSNPPEGLSIPPEPTGGESTGAGHNFLFSQDWHGRSKTPGTESTNKESTNNEVQGSQ